MFDLILFFARGGGGGSGGGGGGGGGGGSYGGSSTGGDGTDFAIVMGIILLACIGLAIGYYTGKIIKRFLHTYAVYASAGLFLVMTVLLITALVASDSKSLLADMFYVITAIGVWGGWYFAYFTIPMPKQKWVEMKNLFTAASAKDKVWDQDAVKQLVKQSFVRFQQDWSMLDASKLQEYMQPAYAQRTMLLMQALKDLNRLNKMEKVTIHAIQFLDITDSEVNDQDSFRALISASANDSIYDTVQKKTLFTDRSRFAEEWVFQRSGDTWLLQTIDQVTAEPSLLNNEIKAFAEANGMVYSLDMGWLLLPSRGQLFSHATFGNSDINNHVIGVYNNILMQLYEYHPSFNAPDRWLIGQINVPKSYGEILVRPAGSPLKKLFGDKINAPQGTQKYDFEWPDFNHKFEVFASDADRLATFELINPGFMAYMYDLDKKITLEVVDNIIYFAIDIRVNADVYQKLLTLLTKAHKELKL